MGNVPEKISNNAFYGIDLQKNGLLIIIGIFIILVVVKSFISLDFYAPFISDEHVYDKEAKILASGKLYPGIGQQPPLYIAFQSIGYILSDNPLVAYDIMLIIGCIFSSTIIFPAYLILKKYVEPLYSILGAVAISTCLALNYFSFTLMQENLYLPLVLFSILAIIEAFETNLLKWQIAAGASIVILEMTKSIAQMAEMAFIGTIVLYLLINWKKGIINVLKSKAALIASFIISYAAWHFFLSNAGKINAILTGQSVKPGIGSTYNTVGITNRAVYAVSNLEEYLRLVQTFLNHIDYLLLASFMLFAILIFFFFTELNTKLRLGEGFKVSEIFIFQMILFSIIGVTIIAISLRSSGSAYFTTIGRYLEPVVPPVILLGLIYICNVKVSDFKKYLGVYVAFSAIVTLFFLITNSTPNNMFSYDQIINNPSSGFYYNLKAIGLLPYSLGLLSIMSFGMFYLALTNKKFITLLMVLLIIVSILVSVIPHMNNLKYSQKPLKDSIEQSLLNNSTVTTVSNEMNMTDVTNDHSVSSNTANLTGGTS
ncbi:glycosyltransferase family 39 protein [Methanocella arvoryzae]|uniref:Uncharacterized protein n=1 Tax=Methanocella arvoryzae (strain DSM 22066 / NBRC 105507 / MRE50) TaxID=351160 RepID=Q0W8V4_METAR|nr:glycosyltransferase family 39 protein [Methanocella arvoryzae]CAJ35189.1 hypothetical protein LRC186 [Methanocella arvoryzae MRE50]